MRYHGSKWKLAPWLVEQFPKHRVYVEPFGGGAAVLLRKPRSYAEIYQELFADWRRIERRALADGARERTEVVWMNFENEETLL